MTTRHPAGPPSAATSPDPGLRSRVALLADALLARGVERDQATRLALAMLEACAARGHPVPPRPS